MFEKLKDFINDFFYKEIEVDETGKTQGKTVPEKLPKISKSEGMAKPKHRAQSRQFKPDVAYRYPKEKTRQFKFPLMEDDQVEQVIQSRQGKRLEKSKARPGLVKTEIKHKRFNAKEIDAVPAYTRKTRKHPKVKKVETDDLSFQQMNEEPLVEEKKCIKEIPPYTRPEELDKVFSKRDGKTVEKESTPQLIKPKTEQKRQRENIVKHVDDLVPRIEGKPEKVTLLKQTEEKVIEKPVEEELKKTPEPVEDIPAFTVKPPVFQVNEKQTVPHHLLDDMVNTEITDDDWLIEQQILLEDAFTQFNIDATVVDVKQGPSITQFEIRPSKGVKVSKIRNLSDDLKLHLSAKEIRIEAPIPGKNTIGIEIPNLKAKTVHLQQLIETTAFESESSPLTIALGLTIDGEPLITNIHKMPHGLIAGATGSGKSVCINTIILSILYKASHEDVKLLLIDPKMVELTPYNQIPHLIAPVITDVKAATKSLKWAVQEMENRYQKFVELGVRNIDKYNEKIRGMTDESYEKMPYIVIIIDELADLMMMSPQEVEDAICRIAQKARACGIHLLLATQRPSVDVITGLIKANIPTRIAFSVSSQVDSRTMLDQSGAEKLLGKGDMLFLENGAKTLRLQGPFVSDDEIERVTDYVKQLAEPDYLFETEELMVMDEEADEDELMNEVLDFVLTEQQASTSLLQRRFRIGYNRAARLIDSLEQKGVISGQNGSKPRDVLVTKEQIDFEH